MGIDGDAGTGRRTGAARLAGVLLVLLGVTNVTLSAMALTGDAIRISDGTGLALGVLGLVTVVLGVLVFRGRRWAILAALVVFGGLFAIQLFASSGGATTPALITLAVLVVPLLVALRATTGERSDDTIGQMDD